MNKKLAEISETMADGYHWFRMREIALDLEIKAQHGDVDAQKILDIMSQFHRLCLLVKRG